MFTVHIRYKGRSNKRISIKKNFVYIHTLNFWCVGGGAVYTAGVYSYTYTTHIYEWNEIGIGHNHSCCTIVAI